MANLLLVEDDEEICEILQFYLLENESYQVTIAHSAEQALPLIRLRRFDLALLDVQLPGRDGIELCEELRKLSNCPVIFISCLSDDDTIIRALFVHVSHLRQKIEDNPAKPLYLRTHLRDGYIFSEPSSSAAQGN